VRVEAVEAGYNALHPVTVCVGYVLTFNNGVQVYVTGDTSKTRQMPRLAERKIDYAFFCADGVYNMDLPEASECAALVKAKHSIPYHLKPNSLFDRTRAEMFTADNRLIIANGEEIILE
jgi:L-ascorbate metabolism protein UlaG (beta-lactamase superfamily)